MKLSIKIPRRDWMVGEWLLNWNALDSAGTNNGTATNVTYTNTDRGFQKQCWVFWATSTVTSSATFTNIQTLYFRIYPTANIKTLATLVTGTSIISINASSQITTTGLANVSVYVNNTATTQLTLNVWNDVVITCDAKTFSNLSIWSSSYTGNIGRVAFFNRAISATEIQNWYLEWLRKLGGGSMSGLMDWLVAYYDMRGDANDIVGGNNGTVTGATLTTDRFGFTNGAYSFNGTNNYIISALAFPTSYTMLIWVKCSSTTSTMRIMQNSNFSLTMNYPSTGKIEFADWINESINSNGSSFNDNSWKCITIVCNNWQANWSKIFSNWVVDSFGTISTSTSTWNTYIWTRSSLAQFYNWIIGEIFLFNTVKNDSEVKAIYDLSSKDYLLSFL